MHKLEGRVIDRLRKASSGTWQYLSRDQCWRRKEDGLRVHMVAQATDFEDELTNIMFRATTAFGDIAGYSSMIDDLLQQVVKFYKSANKKARNEG